MMKKLIFTALVAVAVAFLLSEVPTAESVTCSPLEMSSCGPAIMTGTAPSQTCCSKIKEQKPCFCSYLKNPNLKQYVSSSNAKKVASSCGVAYPKC